MNTSSASFVLEEVPQGARVVVAMSGGVDSSVVAGLMKEAGYNVVGITLQLYDQGELAKRKGACCAGQDIYDAKEAAAKLGIPHYILNYESLFAQKVIDDFVDTYLRGETPVPCIQCNQKVKFQDLLLAAQNLDAAALVTGHYVRRALSQEGTPALFQAVDLSRDQSYFLFGTTVKQLSFLHFPLGSISKSETRAHGRRLGLSIAEKPDSQDICFVAKGSYADFVKKIRPSAACPGDIVHIDGRILGRHAGIVHFTIGQRRGIGIGMQDPLYVVKVDPLTNRVIVGPREALARREVLIKDVNWLGPLENIHEMEVDIKIRSSHPPVHGIVSYNAQNGQAKVFLEEPEYGIAPGQACVFYQKTRVLGGGWITSSATP